MEFIYRCLVIDDETPAHKALISHIAKFSDLEYKGSAYNGKEALKRLNENEYEIIFLDINMPLISGVELMELQPNRPITIVTTAYSDFALSAYEHSAVDYLLKPISLEKFSLAVEKAKAMYRGYAIKETSAGNNEGYFSCRVNGETLEIPLGDILYIESMGNYLRLHRHTAKLPVTVYGSLLSISKELDHPSFIQVHRTYIVNKTFVRSIDQNTITMINDIIIPVGRNYKILLKKE
ncbi:MAG: response regulator transcription factor [Flavobacterium sp.]|nr:MAG: response regulator transcription factor [Flavobacterium sp.]